MKRIFLMIFISFAALSASGDLFAQDNDDDGKLSLTVDAASGFVWRGLSNNSTPVIQPAITFTQGKFSIGTWASTPFVPGDYQEIDIFASYQITPALSIAISDYYDCGWNWDNDRYFNYKKEETMHSFDLQLIYNGDENFPLKATLSTIIGGSDLKTKDGKRKQNFSTYFELGYASTTRSGLDWEIFAGAVPMESEFYDIDGAAVVNIGLGVSKNFEITPTYSLPLSLKFSVNPAHRAAFLVASIALF